MKAIYKKSDKELFAHMKWGIANLTPYFMDTVADFNEKETSCMVGVIFSMDKIMREIEKRFYEQK